MIWVAVARISVVPHRQPKRITAISKNSICTVTSAPLKGIEKIRDRRCPRFRQWAGFSGPGVQLQMGEYRLDHFGIFDAGNGLLWFPCSLVGTYTEGFGLHSYRGRWASGGGLGAPTSITKAAPESSTATPSSSTPEAVTISKVL